ncbi:rh9 [macacine betaherpesvirus 3]|uniref:Rh9 n=1 Tax=Rhesus cytomegalovirus (strain 68-1) TaxID=47929 RepID=Q2FAW3_RHCM6|nr:rh9 [macacine betaherpesvirus 3]
MLDKWGGGGVEKSMLYVMFLYGNSDKPPCCIKKYVTGTVVRTFCKYKPVRLHINVSGIQYGGFGSYVRMSFGNWLHSCVFGQISLRRD